MTRLASRFGASNLIRRDRPLTREELFRVVPSVFSEDKHESRSERYTYIQAPYLTTTDILQARKACGLMSRCSYREVSNIVLSRSRL
ncbi:hypothetical protein EB932_19645 [Salmonella enterica]|nr:hypothetical protein [Salmonella enterica]